jgi:hypothetical protein
VLNRVNKTRPSFFLCDGFQNLFTAARGKSDANFFGMTRQSHHVNIIATQNYPALSLQVGDQDQVASLMSNSM